MFKRITAFLTAFVMCGAIGSVSVNALEPTDVPADGFFHLVDFETNEILDGSYETFQQAKSVYNDIKDSYVNLGIVKDAVTYEAEYALALFHVNDACDFTVNYTNTSDGTAGDINGCYGVDAAYLYTDDAGNHATFTLSGVTAQASLQDVTVVPLQNIYTKLSMFTVQNGDLYHMVKGEMDDDYYAYIIDLGPAPSYLQDNRAYYSYDGHYFYDDSKLYEMLDDYRNGIRDASVNNEDPWYDWYQFVSHRTLTNATRDSMKAYFEESMGVRSPMTAFIDNDKDGISDILTQSQYYGMENAFFQYQYEYGANALMMLAMSDTESGSGRSSLSYTRNNLFAHAAYDDEEEAARGGYYDLRTSILSHAKYYLSGSYLSPMKEQYDGGYFGNLSAGMNVVYSADPYWGEKMASNYRLLDQAMQAGDGYSVQVGIRTVENETVVYKDPDGTTPIYTTGSMPDMAFVIIDEIENDSGKWYEIQSDATLNEDRTVDLSYNYDWENDVAYIKADSIQILIGNRREKPDYATVTYDAGEGEFPGREKTVSYRIPAGSDPVITVPLREGSSFTGFELTEEGDNAYTFEARYRDVTNIELVSMPSSEFELNDRIDLRNGKVRVRYDGGEEQEFTLDTSSVRGYDMSTDGEQSVEIRKEGMVTSYGIHVSAEKDELRVKMKNEIMGLINSYGGSETFTEDQIAQILDVKREMDQTVQPYLTQPDFRTFDTILRRAYNEKINYVIVDNRYGFAVSGLSVSIPLEDGQLDKRETEEDTYRISINSGISHAAEEAMKKCADFFGESVLGTFTITLEKNMENYPMDKPLLCSVARPAGSAGGDVYQVLRFTPEGDVIRCYTRQTTNTISFMTDGPGEFLLMGMTTSNQYIGEDPVEALNQESNGLDIRGIIASAAFGILILAGIIFGVIFLLSKRSRKKNVERHVVKKEQIRKESENLEVTQAIEILNTEMIRLDEIQKAEEGYLSRLKKEHRTANGSSAEKETSLKEPAAPSEESKAKPELAETDAESRTQEAKKPDEPEPAAEKQDRSEQEALKQNKPEAEADGSKEQGIPDAEAGSAASDKGGETNDQHNSGSGSD